MKHFNSHHLIFTNKDARAKGITWLREHDTMQYVGRTSVHNQLHREFPPIDLPNFKEVRGLYRRPGLTRENIIDGLVDMKAERARHLGSYIIWQLEFLNGEHYNKGYKGD